jgi:hypothetical protein
MDKQKIISLLSWFNQQNVENYANYCYKLQNEKKKDWTLQNPWSTKITEEKFAELFKKVDNEWLVFDWNHITLQSTGISYDYVALKNKMIIAYPESTIDIQLVYEWDDIEFGKTNWKVEYNHKLKNPFDSKDKDIIGAYTVIKNKRWEFLTTLSKEELEKHRKTAKTDYIRAAWYKEMCMKTIMKKACKMHFWDIFTKIEEMDNDNYSLDNPLELEIWYKSEIDAIKTIDELKEYYAKNKWKGKDFDKYISIRKEQLL